MPDYQATPEQWADAGAFASDTRACLLELRAKVEALEANATCPHIVTSSEGTSYCTLAEANSKPTPNQSQIRSSLVERVALAISGIEYGLERDEEAVNWASEARAAIREMALWLNEEPLDLYPGDRGIVVNALYDQANQ
jgi:hypothetical protein